MRKKLLLVAILVLSVSALKAQALLYRPVNPNFGGNTFNYQWLQGSAQAQDRLKDPTATSTSTSRTATTGYGNSLDNFSETLSRQLLSRITSQLLASQFGEETLQEGTFQFGDMRIDITNAANGVNIRIVDGQGGQTNITVPYF